MLRPFKVPGVRINGLYNSCKRDIMVTLYYFCVMNNLSGLTMDELEVLSGVSYEYLNVRLPVFARKRVYPITGKLWKKALVARRPVERQNRLFHLYKISSYGRKWVEDLDRDEFWECFNRLQPGWEQNKETIYINKVPLSSH